MAGWVGVLSGTASSCVRRLQLWWKNKLVSNVPWLSALLPCPQAAGEGRDHGLGGAVPHRRPCGRSLGCAGVQ